MAKTRTTKRALLASVLSLVLCASMLLGTTFAWFTDSVTSANNIITSGNLDVEMYWAQGTEDPATVTWTDASTGAIFNYENWEPGYVDVKHIKIENKGSLALQYKVTIIANGEVSDLADVIDVYYVDPAVQVSDRSALTDANKIGSLTEILASLGTSGTGTLLANTADTVTIALKMREDAGNDYMNKSIGTDFSVQLYAIQFASESDAFGNQYDASVVFPAVSNKVPVGENATAATFNMENMSVEAPAEFFGSLNGVANEIYVGHDGMKIEGDTVVFENVEFYNENGAVIDLEGNTENVTVTLYVGDKFAAGARVKIYHDEVEVAAVVVDENGYVSYAVSHFCNVTVAMNTDPVEVVVTSEDELRATLSNLTEPVVINAAGVTLAPTGSLSTTISIPAGVTIKNAKFASGSQCYLVTTGSGEDVVFENCTFDGPGFGMFVIAGNDQDGAAMVFENCIFKGQIAPNFVQNSNGTATFNNCTFTVGSDNIGLVNCMGGTHTFNQCTFDYTGGSTFGSNQYVRWNAVNSYSENYSTKVILNGCTFKNCGTQRFGGNSTLTIK